MTASPETAQKTSDPEAVTRDDFTLDAIGDDIDIRRERVMNHSGIIIHGGFPLDRYSGEQPGMIHFGCGTYLG